MMIVMIMMFLLGILFFNKLNKLLIQHSIFIVMFLMLFYSVSMEWGYVTYMMSIDMWSYYLILLSFWIVGIIFMILEKKTSLMFYMLMLMMFMVMTFMSFNILMFYIFFEMSLVPIFLIIMSFGVNFSRIEASLYMLLYTISVSLPLMVLLFKYVELSGSMMFDLIQSINMGWIEYMTVIMAMLVKLPMYTMHLWLPKAHVEAPVYGSMILAGVLLKLGGYGLMRFMMIFKSSALNFNIYYMSVGLVGMVVTSIICMNQVDMKILVAYSSVVHMGLFLVGSMTLSSVGYMGGYLMMLGHGLCSSGLFYLVNIIYSRTGTRLIYMVKGTMSLMPSMSLWWFLFCSSNLGAPMSLNFISEIFLISSILGFSIILFVYVMLYCFLGAAYSLYLYSLTQHGSFSKYIINSSLLVDYLVLILHWVPLGTLFLNLWLF